MTPELMTGRRVKWVNKFRWVTGQVLLLIDPLAITFVNALQRALRSKRSANEIAFSSVCL